MLASLVPRRRRLAVGAVLAVLFVAVAVIVVTTGLGGGGHQARPVAQGVAGPALLIPGYGGSRQSLEVLATRLRAGGRDVTVVALPDDATGDIADQASTLASAVRGVVARTKAASVDLVGYSDGGVVARYYVRFGGGNSVVRRVVTLGTPNHGTNLASATDAFGGALCTGACAQVLPGSSFLDRLNSGDESPAGPDWLSLWTENDTTVTPPDSARLQGAVNIDLQTVCADEQVSHGGLPQDPLVIGIVMRSLDVAPLTQPGPADCASLRTLGTAPTT
jgi:triacylglycerol lipase